MKRYLTLFLTLLLLLLASGCTGPAKEAEGLSKSNLMLDTVITITLYDEGASVETIDLAFEEIRRLEGLLSVEQAGSDLDRLAQAAGKDWVDIAPETEEVLRLAKEYHTLSEGHFDVTAGPLIDLWNIHNGEGHVPTQAELDQVLPLVSSENLLIQPGKAYLAKEGMVANLGAIAKGYIADKTKEFLIRQGVERAILDLGHNVLLIGGKSEHEGFTVGVNDPTQEGMLIDAVALVGQSAVTAGIDERKFTVDGKTYHHILDPFTGYPADTGLASVTILSDNSAQGDALSTTCLLLGQEKGMALVERLEGVEALFITTQGKLVPSSGYEAYRAAQ